MDTANASTPTHTWMARLSWSGRLIKYQDGTTTTQTSQQSPIPVLTRLNVDNCAATMSNHHVMSPIPVLTGLNVDNCAATMSNHHVMSPIPVLTRLNVDNCAATMSNHHVITVCQRQANTVEQSASTASETGHHLPTIQTIAENVWLVGPWRLVSRC